MRRLRFRTSFIFGLACIVSPAAAQDEEAPFPPAPELNADWEDLFGAAAPETVQEAREDGTPGAVIYRLEENDLDQFDFAPVFRELSALRAGEGETLTATAELNRRIRADRALLQRLFRTAGYFDPLVTMDVEPVRPERPDLLVVRFGLDSGPLYTFAGVGPNAAELLDIAEGDPVDTGVIEASMEALRVYLPDEGFPFAEIAEPDIVVDHETRTATIELDVDRGERARFGEVRVASDAIFTARHIERLARFRRGDVYRAEAVEDLRRALIATGLVGSVVITPEPTGRRIDGNAEVAILVDIQPAPLRTVAGQIGFSSTDGFRIEGSWQHRNLFPPEGAFTVRGVAGTEEQLLAAELRRSNYKARDRTIGIRFAAQRQDRDAFFAQGIGAIAYLERETNLIWQKRWTYRIGPELLFTEERDRSAPGAPVDSFVIAAFHGRLSYDGTDDLLNPTEDIRVTGEIIPEFSLQDGAFGYARAQLEASTYLPLAEDRSFVVAGRGLVGSIVGAGRRRIAPSRRFYAGGGGSVRGFGFQDVGPEDADGDPLGGRSVVEFSLEGRYRFGDFGLVPFIDAGQVYTSSQARLSDLRVGVGVGARYFTRFGPIRVDFATPLDRRSGEPAVAVYVSIGQAF